jgi:hypothetical protein
MTKRALTSLHLVDKLVNLTPQAARAKVKATESELVVVD